MTALNIHLQSIIVTFMIYVMPYVSLMTVATSQRSKIHFICALSIQRREEGMGEQRGREKRFSKRI